MSSRTDFAVLSTETDADPDDALDLSAEAGSLPGPSHQGPSAPKKLRRPQEPAADGGRAGTLLEGMVVEGARGAYKVDTPQGVLLCELRGKLRKTLVYAASSSLKGTTFRHKVRRANVAAKDPVAVGDRVRVLPMGSGRGMIEEILPRTGGALTREDSGVASRAGTGSVTSVAGVTQLVAVFATRDPEPHLRLLDRMLVLAEAQDLAAAVCLNKLDLGASPDLLERLDLYRRLGYPVVLVSASTGEGLPELRHMLGGHTSAFLGPSGVGKSSLLNALEPGLGQRVSAVGSTTHKGRHTTTGTRVVALAEAAGCAPGFVADTAGIRALALGGVAAGKLDWCFRDLRPYLGRCFHADCTHVHEPGCAVAAAADTGEIDPARLDSYRRLHDQGAAEAGRRWRDAVVSLSLVGEGEFRL